MQLQNTNQNLNKMKNLFAVIFAVLFANFTFGQNVNPLIQTQWGQGDPKRRKPHFFHGLQHSFLLAHSSIRL